MVPAMTTTVLDTVGRSLPHLKDAFAAKSRSESIRSLPAALRRGRPWALVPPGGPVRRPLVRAQKRIHYCCTSTVRARDDGGSADRGRGVSVARVRRLGFTTLEHELEIAERAQLDT